jgi:hypothetical protein
MDLRRTRVRAAVKDGHAEDALFARAYRGVVEGTLERVLLQGLVRPDRTELHTSMGASVIMEGTHAERGTLTLLRGAGARPKVDLDADTQARLREELTAGFLLLTPDRTVTVAGAARYGWWRIDPRTGDVVAVADDGLHAEIEYYHIVHDQARKQTFIVAVLTGGHRYVVDAAVWGTPYFRTMMSRIVDGLEMWRASNL